MEFVTKFSIFKEFASKFKKFDWIVFNFFKVISAIGIDNWTDKTIALITNVIFITMNFIVSAVPLQIPCANTNTVKTFVKNRFRCFKQKIYFLRACFL